MKDETIRDAIIIRMEIDMKELDPETRANYLNLHVDDILEVHDFFINIFESIPEEQYNMKQNQRIIKSLQSSITSMIEMIIDGEV